jgi:dihydroxy-acid dehydratase
VGHIAPEATVGGPIGQLEDGDVVTIDVPNRRIDVDVDADAWAARQAAWTPPAPRYTSGVLAKYGRSFASASDGAVTNPALHSTE